MICWLSVVRLLHGWSLTLYCSDFRYYNDIHAFNTETYRWIKLDVSGIPPSPRSGACLSCQLVYCCYSTCLLLHSVAWWTACSEQLSLLETVIDFIFIVTIHYLWRVWIGWKWGLHQYLLLCNFCALSVVLLRFQLLNGWSISIDF